MPGADNIVSLRQSTLHSVKLPRSFYEQNTIVVAQELLGQEGVIGKIVLVPDTNLVSPNTIVTSTR